MKTGFIGAGKAGVSMGKYLSVKGIHVSGFYSRSRQSSEEAARFTDTKQYLSKKELVRDCDVVFLSVPDSAISQVWEQIRTFPLQNKLICHFSGAMSSAVFSEIASVGAYGYSIHPLFAFHDKYESYKELSKAFFTIEGSQKKMNTVKQMLSVLGNDYAVIRAEDKIRYHAAAAICSNLYVGLVYMGEHLLEECGFTGEQAQTALSPLIMNNAENIASVGPVRALTGPVERGDLITVKEHLEALSGEQQAVYRAVSGQVLRAAEEKNPERDYSQLKALLLQD